MNPENRFILSNRPVFWFSVRPQQTAPRAPPPARSLHVVRGRSPCAVRSCGSLSLSLCGPSCGCGRRPHGCERAPRSPPRRNVAPVVALRPAGPARNGPRMPRRPAPPHFPERGGGRGGGGAPARMPVQAGRFSTGPAPRGARRAAPQVPRGLLPTSRARGLSRSELRLPVRPLALARARRPAMRDPGPWAGCQRETPA
jgi:hypothetical protein